QASRLHPYLVGAASAGLHARPDRDSTRALAGGNGREHFDPARRVAATPHHARSTDSGRGEPARGGGTAAAVGTRHGPLHLPVPGARARRVLSAPHRRFPLFPRLPFPRPRRGHVSPLPLSLP